MSSTRPVIAVTMGDPCGVGPEVIAKALAEPGVFDLCAPVVFGDLGALRRAADLTGARLTFCEGDDPAACPPLRVPVVNPLPLSSEDLHFGRPTKRACQAAVKAVEEAVAMALRGEAEAVCTAPVHKANLHRHGFPFPGHTEFLQSLTGAQDVVMMLAGPRLRVSLATIHCALSEVPRLLTAPLLFRTIEITGEALARDFGLAAPRVAVAALNPHAGEDGRFGHEERDMMAGVIRASCGRAWHVSGPFPPDTVFYRAYRGEFDAVVAMYHDQGLIPLKLVHFETAVNVTLGLPIIRTSVDHGTAYDIAGTGKASATSLTAALQLAAEMAKNRRRAVITPAP